MLKKGEEETWRKKEEESQRKKEEKKEGKVEKEESKVPEFLQATRVPQTLDATLQNSLQYLLTNEIVSNFMLNGKKKNLSVKIGWRFNQNHNFIITFDITYSRGKSLVVDLWTHHFYSNTHNLPRKQVVAKLKSYGPNIFLLTVNTI